MPQTRTAPTDRPLHTIRHILLVADPGTCQPALGRALALAEHCGAHVTVIAFVHDPVADAHDSLLASAQRAQLRERLLHTRRQLLLTEVREAHPKVNVEVQVEWAKRYHEWLVTHIDTLAADLVIKNARPNKRPFILPSDWFLIRYLARPLWLVHPTARHQGGLCATVDAGSDDSRQRALDHEVLTAASALAGVMKQPLDAAYVRRRPSALFDFDLVDKTQYKRKALAEARIQLADLLRASALSEPVRAAEVMFGEPARELASLVRRRHYQLVVFGTVAREGVAEWLVGNTAEQMIAVLGSDVLVIKHAADTGA